MTKIDVYSEYVGLDWSLQKTSDFCKDRFYNTPAGKWISDNNIILSHRILNEGKNWAMPGLVLILFISVTEEQAAEYYLRFK